ncbi:proteasome assembly chaperone 1 [Esox lucius]|uniref:Proteasome assembly chaperone 1 n=1 Tax=Esox lucius TaxID=8010 RepID=C1BX00_ESOLU|nr:proteasome assembly chaperone 1 [Esox lucius]ACO13553.1 Proteasome assembly chaperone 1 [Esox lucius]
MATFFGEVLSVYSRAVEEDDDELDDENEEDEQIRREIEEKREVYIEWYPDVTQSVSSGNCTLQCSDLIIAVGPNASGFLSAYVLNTESWDAVGHVSLWNEKSRCTSRQPPLPGEPACRFYRHRDNPSVLMCQSTCYVAEDQLFQWADKVFGSLLNRGLNVMVLSDSPVAEYKTPDYLYGSAVPFLRSLKSSAFKDQALCPALEQPNILTGLPAAVLSHCQVHRIPAVLYQCYTDVIGPDTVTMETYKPALTSLSKLVKLEPCPSADALRRFAKVSEAQSNLYT